jgi:hypothetical protein
MKERLPIRTRRRELMVDNIGMEGWVGKVVQLWATGEDEPWLGILEGWSERGVILCYSEDIARFEASRDDRQSSPMLMLFPWSGVRYIGIDLEVLEGDRRPP